MEIFLKKNKQRGTLISDTRVRLNFKFHSNLNISVQKLKNIPTYYKNFLKNWRLHLTSSPILPPAIASQALWSNKTSKLIIRVFIYLKFLEKAYGHNEGLFLPSSYAVLEYEFEQVISSILNLYGCSLHGCF